ncbi:hypothetical protein U9M48_038235 [Paspalum notatum var. saurae]|uniref:DUF6598 domain-containing protein n=1 Tax=Paspalum notatum var. saurae TaxID=547442 RepID=A0AAQ3UGI4_PASNO
MFCEIPPSQYYSLDDSVNIISIKITESDVRYPIKVYGTVLARDQNDYRCVYLFKRGRDNPQLITRKNRMIDLTGPYRALNGTSFMYFEFHLKIKGKGAVDRDFSKGVRICNVTGDAHGQLRALPLESFLSRVDVMNTHLLLESILNGISKFHGKISAWTSGNDNKINLYDSELSSTKRTLGSGGSVSLSRHIVSVPRNEDLVLYIFARGWNNESKHLKLVLGHDVEEHTCKISTYVLQVKIIWKAVFRQDRPHMWKVFGGNNVLWVT